MKPATKLLRLFIFACAVELIVVGVWVWGGKTPSLLQLSAIGLGCYFVAAFLLRLRKKS